MGLCGVLLCDQSGSSNPGGLAAMTASR
jgi:hypothetical protein